MPIEAVARRFTGSVLDKNSAGRCNPMGQSYTDNFLSLAESPPLILSSEKDANGYPSEEGAWSDATLKLINQMLMEEEDLVHKPCMFTDILALQATEKSFYDALVSPQQDLPPRIEHRDTESPDGSSSWSYSSDGGSVWTNHSVVSDRVPNQGNSHDYILQLVLKSFSSSNIISGEQAFDGQVDSLITPFQGQESGTHGRDSSPDGLRGKKARDRDDSESDDPSVGRSNKQLASYVDESDDEPQEAYDKVLLCPRLNPHLHQDCESCSHYHCLKPNEAVENLQNSDSGKSSNRRKARGKKQGNKMEVVDLSTLLTQCAQAAVGTDLRNAYELLRQIRQHSSPQGDGSQRLAHYFADALEARLAGNGTEAYAAFTTKKISAADILKGYQVYVTACPFNKVSNAYANRSIMKLAANADSLHIIDFGILYGFQWPCLIQGLSVRPGGPPRLRITGIDFPQPGFRPVERVEETGRRLETYCKRFKVAFQYTAIAKRWDTIKLEDLEINQDEVLVVNSLYRLTNLHDETVILNSPRDAVLNLIKEIKPDLFIHGEINGMYSAPFFVSRFREAIFHFSSWFDVFDSTIPRENRERMLYEQEILGRGIMNVVACEGTERVERPETYKQWQVRNKRAGFKQLPLNREIVEEINAVVKPRYHKDFLVDTDGKWMLQGWKGRIIYAISSWKPVEGQQL